ncbi:MAG: hypothetical protein IPM45_01125 [Acidimicrobiales bacterium]|nr:hypothetical protein [Acidimicrobiales bacterium]
MKKGRHRRFEEARALKRSHESLDLVLDDEGERRVSTEPCAECGAEPGESHASWCLAEEDADAELEDDDDR